jgi:DNA-binding FrmR family transcriptional regulator
MENLVHEKNRENILLRLRKIEGQIRGIQKMVQREAECEKILAQVAAAKSAMKKVATLMIQNYLKDCVTLASDPLEGDRREQRIEEWIRVVSRYLE